MFTGIIQTLGTVIAVQHQSEHQILACQPAESGIFQVHPGSSIAVNGVCLTVKSMQDHLLWFDVSHETLARTNLQYMQSGQKVNLEPAARLQDRLDGHLVSGHVDGLAEIVAQRALGDTWQFEIRPPQELLPFIAVKGSVCIDGVSLTVNQLKSDRFVIDIIPFTWEHTVMQYYQPGYQANLEVDLIARYVARLLQSGTNPAQIESRRK